MKKLTAVLFCASLLLLSVSCALKPAPQRIPLVGKNAAIHTEVEIAPGVVYSYQYYRKLFERPLSLSILTVDLNKADLKACFVMCDDKRLTPQEFGEKHHAIAAVNAGYFVMRSNPPRPAWGRKTDGKVVQKFSRIRNSGVIAFSSDGKNVKIVPSANVKQYDPEKDPFPTACLSQPLLIRNGKKHIEDPDKAYKNMVYAPRTIAALAPGNKLILIVADGRTKESGGLRYSEAQTILLKYFGATDALAMDGGGSAAMWIRGKGIVSNPSDNHKFDHKGTRPVHDAIVICGKAK